MRINVYSQELITDRNGGLPDYELIAKTSENGVTYFGVRMFFHSSDRLHHVEDDDDRSAITFWLPQSTDRRQYLADTLHEMAGLIMSATPEIGMD